MGDYGHYETERELKRLEKELDKQYSIANKEITKKVDNYFDKFAKRDASKLEQLNSGKITEKEYLKWRESKMLTGQRWTEMQDVIAKDLTNTNLISAKMITDNMANVYALNANYGMYEISKGANASLSFSLYDKKTVERMIKDKKFPIPVPRVDIPKDLQWNKQKINSAMLQGILQGESVDKISKRLQSVTNMNRVAALRNARTYITGAENRGRLDSYKEAESLGIEMGKQWIATNDDRTRDSHLELDGVIVGVNELFPNGCEYPGDPTAEPEEFYNCRCTMIAAINGHVLKEEPLKEDERDFKAWEKSESEEE